MLSGGELKELYSKAFVIFETEPVRRNRDEYLKKLPAARWTPNFVFLDSDGEVVLEIRGFNNQHEAKAIHEFVTKRLYKTTDFKQFLASYPH